MSEQDTINECVRLANKLLTEYSYIKDHSPLPQERRRCDEFIEYVHIVMDNLTTAQKLLNEDNI